MILVTLGHSSGLERLLETTVGLWVRTECKRRGGEGKDVNKESLILSIILGESLLSQRYGTDEVSLALSGTFNAAVLQPATLDSRCTYSHLFSSCMRKFGIKSHLRYSSFRSR